MTRSMGQVTLVEGGGLLIVITCNKAPFFLNDRANKAGFPLLGVRDYIHVVDLAKGHIAALRKLKERCGCKVGGRTQGRPFPGWFR